MGVIYHYRSGITKTFLQKNLKLIILAIAGIFIFSQLAILIQPAKAEVSYVVNSKIRICHATSSESNPFNSITVNLSALKQAHGISDDPDDVIPPHEDEPEGRNWDAEGQALWLDNCGDGEVLGDICIPGNVFMIGDKEVDQLNDNPADELSWAGAFGDFSNPTDDPFIVGTSTDDHFPWNSNFSAGKATDFSVDFVYEGGDATEATLTVAWSPGRSGVETKQIHLDGNLVGETTHNGTSTAGWFEQMEVFEDRFTFELTNGPHTLNFKHLSGDGTLWDYVSLDVTSCPSIPDDCVFGPGWASLVTENNQGFKKNNDAVGAERSNPDDVLGAPDVAEPTVAGFYSLGFGGDITVTFDGWIINVDGDDLSFHETTFGNRDNYGEETAKVEVSQNETNWYELTETLSGRNNESGPGVTLVDFDETGLDWIKYVRVTDTSNPSNFTDANADGYDIDAIDATNQECSEPEQFDEEILGSISGLLYNDENGNASKQPNEEPISDWDVWLLTKNSPYTIKDIYTTGPDGTYLFENLPLGTYYVCQDIPEGWLQTQLNFAGSGGVDSSTPANNDVLDLDDDEVLSFCYQVELTDEEPDSEANDFGNRSGLLGVTDTNDPGNTLGDTDTNDEGEVLADSGQPAILMPIVGILLITSALTLVAVRVKS